MVRRVEVELGPGETGVPMARAVQEVIDDRSVPIDGVVISPAIERPESLAAGRFFNPRNPAQPARIVLERTFETEREVFRLREPIGYWDDEVGAVIVPDNLGGFDTDLTSVMRFFTWLVTTTGVHLPAALVHDGLIPGRSAGSSYVAGQEIDRVTADRIFRSGMRHLGTSWLQRWLIWSAVATATMVSAPWRRAWRSWVAVLVTVVVVVVGGTFATIDLFDCRDVVPWMGDQPAWREVFWGAVGAVDDPDRPVGPVGTPMAGWCVHRRGPGPHAPRDRGAGHRLLGVRQPRRGRRGRATTPGPAGTDRPGAEVGRVGGRRDARHRAARDVGLLSRPRWRFLHPGR